jgi:hypothetical protein
MWKNAVSHCGSTWQLWSIKNTEHLDRNTTCYCFPHNFLSSSSIKRNVGIISLYWIWHFSMYKVVQIWLGLFVCKQVTVCPGHIWTTLYYIQQLTFLMTCFSLILNCILEEEVLLFIHVICWVLCTECTENIEHYEMWSSVFCEYFRKCYSMLTVVDSTEVWAVWLFKCTVVELG